MDYTSVNGFEVKVAKRDVDEIISKTGEGNSIDEDVSKNKENTVTKKETKKEKKVEKDTEKEENTEEVAEIEGISGDVINYMVTGSIVVAAIVWIVCVISLILNIVKKRIVRIIFTIIFAAIPGAAIYTTMLGRDMYNDGDELGIFIMIMSILASVISIFLALTCVTPKKKKAL